MLIGRKQLIAVAALAAMFLIVGDARAEGGYTPCIVRPVLVKPVISPTIIVSPEIVPAAFINAAPNRWGVEIADIEKATFVQSVFSPTRYDGCAEPNAERNAILVRLSMTSLVRGSSSSAVGAIAARVFTDDTLCCGAGGGK